MDRVHGDEGVGPEGGRAGALMHRAAPFEHLEIGGTEARTGPAGSMARPS